MASRFWNLPQYKPYKLGFSGAGHVLLYSKKRKEFVTLDVLANPETNLMNCPDMEGIVGFAVTSATLALMMLTMNYVIRNTLFKISKFNLLILDFSLFVCQFLNILEHLDLLSILKCLGNGSPEGANFQGIPRHFPSKKCTLEHLGASYFT